MRNPILEERGKTHGDFGVQAAVSQQLKRIAAQNIHDPILKESAEMICLKLSRIANGDAEARDHWEDIVGYAQLAIEELERPKSQSAGSMGGNHNAKHG